MSNTAKVNTVAPIAGGSALAILGAVDDPLRSKPVRQASGRGFKRSIAVWREARRKRVLFLFARGVGLPEIATRLAAECGSAVSYRTVARDVRAALDGSAALDGKTVDRERSADVERCNAMLATWLPHATNSDSKRAKLASEIIHRTLTRRARLLGLDFAAAGSGTNIAIQNINQAAPASAVPDIDFSTWSDAEIRAWRFLSDKAAGKATLDTLESIMAVESAGTILLY